MADRTEGREEPLLELLNQHGLTLNTIHSLVWVAVEIVELAGIGFERVDQFPSVRSNQCWLERVFPIVSFSQEVAWGRLSPHGWNKTATAHLAADWFKRERHLLNLTWSA